MATVFTRATPTFKQQVFQSNNNNAYSVAGCVLSIHEFSDFYDTTAFADRGADVVPISQMKNKGAERGDLLKRHPGVQDSRPAGSTPAYPPLSSDRSTPPTCLCSLLEFSYVNSIPSVRADESGFHLKSNRKLRKGFEQGRDMVTKILSLAKLYFGPSEPSALLGRNLSF